MKMVKSKKNRFFKRHAWLSLRFNKGFMDALWIRNLTNHSIVSKERECSPNGTFYIEDGNHRALVYVVHLELGMAVYEPVDAIHATSWDIANGILGHSMQPMNVLEHNGELQGEKHCQNEFCLPIGIQVNTFKRSNRF